MKQMTLYLAALFFIFVCMPAQAQSERIEALDSQGVLAKRDGNLIYLQVDQDVKSPIVIPRLAAPLRSMHWQGSDADHGLTLKPDQATWQINWDQRPQGSTMLVLEFDAAPLLPSEIKPTTASGDGSFYLPAHLAQTTGEKIRYEPQPNKNTVGYWVGKEDASTWTFKLDKPGRYSVAILQGCGKGQGGSKARLSVMQFQRHVANHELRFEVVETGHFQNFRWVHVGEIELEIIDNYELTILPGEIAKAALMDIRAIHLIRLPDAK